MKSNLSVAVAICTYRRPHLLGSILSDLSKQTFAKVRGVEWKIIVVDNDNAASAREVVDGFRENLPCPVLYYVEGNKGLSSVRNAAIKCAAGLDYLAFVDDDEGVAENWLDELLNSVLLSGSQFAIGPVRPVFPDNVWRGFVDSRLYHRQEFDDLSAIETGNTGNAIVDLSFLDDKGISFRSEFENSGGEDTCFFSDIFRSGGKGVYALRAVAEEPVPEERLSIYWLLRRRCRFGSTEAIQAKLAATNSGGPGRLLISLRFFGAGLARFGASVLFALLVLPFNVGHALRYACAGARGVGYFFGALGINVREY